MSCKKHQFWLALVFVPFFWVLTNGSFPQSVGELRDQTSSTELLNQVQRADELARELDAGAVNSALQIYLSTANNLRQLKSFDRAAESLRSAASIYIPLGRSDKAIECLTEARRLEGRGRDQAGSVSTLALLSTAHLRVGNVEAARKWAIDAVRMSQVVGTPESLATASFAQALVDYDDGQFDLAKRNFESALAKWKTAGNIPGQVRAMLELAYSHMTNDDLVEGLETASEGLRLAEQIQDKRYVIYSRNATAVIKSKLGRKQEALDIFRRSEIELPNDVNLLEQGDMLNHMAGLYEDLDEVRLGLTYRLKALEIFRRMGNLYAQLAVLSKIGLLTFKIGEEKQALEYFEEGFRIARKVESEYFTAVLNQDLGNAYFESDKRRALEYYNRALPKFRRLKIRTHISIVTNKIGTIHLDAGDFKSARIAFNTALELSRETRNEFAEAQNLYCLARLHDLEGNTDAALELVEKSVEITERLTSDVINAKLRTTYFSNVFDRYELHISLLMSKHRTDPDGRFDGRALITSENSRARVLRENVALSGAIPTLDADPETVARFITLRESLNAKADKLTNLLSKDSNKSEIDRIERDIAQFENELESIKTVLKQKSPEYSSAQNPDPFDPEVFSQTFLGDDTILVAFSLGTNESFAWVIGQNEFRSFRLPAAAEIESLVDKIRGNLNQYGIGKSESIDEFEARISTNTIKFREASRQLSQILFSQFAETLGNKRLIIVPDGGLNYYPLGVLPNPLRTDDEPIIATNEVVYQPSAQLAASFLGRKPKESVSKDLLILSDGVFTSDDPRIKSDLADADAAASRSGSGGHSRMVESLNGLSRLTLSQHESDSIVNLIGDAKSDVFTGFSATRGRLLQTKVEDYKILHFATHGLMDEKRPELSGLVFSRFDETGTPVDAIVRLQDIYLMRLNADLVVLSACETGVGKHVRGEGLISLNNAFLRAGAKTVVSSLWKVEDGATLELMKHFYAAMIDEKLPPPAALRKAQLALRRNPRYSSPFYWAAFTVQGDFRSVPQIEKSDRRLYFVGGAIGLLFTGLFLWFRFDSIRSRMRRLRRP